MTTRPTTGEQTITFVALRSANSTGQSDHHSIWRPATRFPRQGGLWESTCRYSSMSESRSHVTPPSAGRGLPLRARSAVALDPGEGDVDALESEERVDWQRRGHHSDHDNPNDHRGQTEDRVSYEARPGGHDGKRCRPVSADAVNRSVPRRAIVRATEIRGHPGRPGKASSRRRWRRAGLRVLRRHTGRRASGEKEVHRRLRCAALLSRRHYESVGTLLWGGE